MNKLGQSMPEKRFVKSERDGLLNGTQVIVDTKTGVQYLFVYEGNRGGLTVLADKDGKPLLDEKYVRTAE
jgi:hypothetical protein